MQKPVEIRTIEDWELFKNGDSYKNILLIFKYSPSCHISLFVERLFDKWLKDTDLPLTCVKINVLSARPLSRHIAEECRVVHESPQLLVINNGRLHSHNSHHGIMDHLQELAF